MKPVLRTSAAVLLAHVGILWLLVHQGASPTLSGTHEQVIVASVVAEQPSPVASPQRQAPARPVAPSSPQPQPQPTAVQQATPPTASPGTPNEPATSARTAAPTSVAALVLPSSDADYLHNPPPAYPRMSRRMGEQGTVLVRVFISTEGRAEKAELRTSSGHARLDEAALETVQRWRYVPGKRAGQPEAMWFTVPIRFVLD